MEHSKWIRDIKKKFPDTELFLIKEGVYLARNPLTKTVLILWIQPNKHVLHISSPCGKYATALGSFYIDFLDTALSTNYVDLYEVFMSRINEK